MEGAALFEPTGRELVRVSGSERVSFLHGMLTCDVEGLAEGGVLIADIYKGSPAEKAGLKGATGDIRIGNMIIASGGDLIAALNGKTIKSMDEFNDYMDSFEVGQTITLKVIRDGKTVNVRVRLEEMPRGN